MRKMLAVVVLPLLFAVTSFAGDDLGGADLAAAGSVASLSRVVGVITSPGVSSPVAGIASGTTPWTTTSGSITVHSTGAVAFSVPGLVLVGGDSSGTLGKVAKVKGTLVCNPGYVSSSRNRHTCDSAQPSRKRQLCWDSHEFLAFDVYSVVPHSCCA
jgi:hypothetical protein